MIQEDLVFDIGMHTGVDTAYYLSKGFRVMAVEANPSLVSKTSERFADEIKAGRLTIEGVGIHNRESSILFYVNDQVDEWSSVERHLGTRQNTRYHEIEIPTKPLSYFIETYGMPFYMKIDVEGLDAAVARQLAPMPERPRFISVEEGGIDSLIALYEIGVRQFKFVNQLESWAQHGNSSSGPFGEDIPGPWLAPDHAFQFYCSSVLPPEKRGVNVWWDIHGKIEPV